MKPTCHALEKYGRDLTAAARQGKLDPLIERGYDPPFGARPLKRVVQRELQDAIASRILQGEIHEGDTVSVDTAPGAEALTITVLAPETQPTS